MGKKALHVGTQSTGKHKRPCMYSGLNKKGWKLSVEKHTNTFFRITCYLLSKIHRRKHLWDSMFIGQIYSSMSILIGPPVRIWWTTWLESSSSVSAHLRILRWQPWAQRDLSSVTPHTRTRQCRNTSWIRREMGMKSCSHQAYVSLYKYNLLTYSSNENCWVLGRE